MNTTRKGQRLCQEVCGSARARGLMASTVPMSGHLGSRIGGLPCDLVIEEWRVEAKHYKGGIGSKQVESILDGGENVGVHAVVHKRDRGVALVTLGLEDWLDLMAKAKGKASDG